MITHGWQWISTVVVLGLACEESGSELAANCSSREALLALDGVDKRKWL